MHKTICKQCCVYFLGSNHAFSNFPFFLWHSLTKCMCTSQAERKKSGQNGTKAKLFMLSIILNTLSPVTFK